MGRYYHGDIEGKFWFAVQSSCDGEYFGMEEQEPSYLPYYSDDLDLAEKGVAECKEKLRGYLTIIRKFFNNRSSYTDKSLAEALEVSEEKTSHLLAWYARLTLGEKIVRCIKEEGSCWYEAEL
jgi:hypothetical protein|tara:strand:- start:484 stop:852 length:369 start_codon:yes stop_codon:yes gene_type:complete